MNRDKKPVLATIATISACTSAFAARGTHAQENDALAVANVKVSLVDAVEGTVIFSAEDKVDRDDDRHSPAGSRIDLSRENKNGPESRTF